MRLRSKKKFKMTCTSNHGQIQTGGYVIGFDVSTQSCKALVVDINSIRIVREARVHYDTDLPGFGTHDGVHKNNGNTTITSPAAMWAQAIDMAIRRLGENVLSEVLAVSGGAQQHGSVYLRDVSADSCNDVSRVVGDNYVLDIEESPIWMDSYSTREVCADLSSKFPNIREWTGSNATERFTVCHIKRLLDNGSLVLSPSIRICLVSSFCTSVLSGKICPIDYCDAAGMNLMDIRKKEYIPAIMQEWLGFSSGSSSSDDIFGSKSPVAPWTVVGSSAHHPFLPVDARMVSWSGDNPCSLVGMGIVQPGDILISLGTSDTCMFVMPSLVECGAEIGHTFPHPVIKDGYFGMLVYANGDITRRFIRDKFANKTWDEFARQVAQSTPNPHEIHGYFTTDEITPILKPSNKPRNCSIIMCEEGSNNNSNTPKCYSCCCGDDSTASKDINPCQSVVWYRAISMYMHIQRLSGLSGEGRLFITGGASTNTAICQVFADVFNRPVRRIDNMPDACAYGAAIRAIHGLYLHQGDIAGANKVITRLVDHTSALIPAASPSMGQCESTDEYVALINRLCDSVKSIEAKLA